MKLYWNKWKYVVPLNFVLLWVINDCWNVEQKIKQSQLEINQFHQKLQHLRLNRNGLPAEQNTAVIWTKLVGEEIRIQHVKNIGTVLIQQDQYHKNRVELIGTFKSLLSCLERLENHSNVLITQVGMRKGKNEKERVLILELCEK